MTKIEEGLKKHIYELEQELESTHKIVAKQSADITVYEEIVDDLEAKLAESESVRKGANEEIKKLHKRINEIVERDKNIVENLNRQLEDKDKEITQRLVIQEKDYYEELNELKQQLAITKEALKLLGDKNNYFVFVDEIRETIDVNYAIVKAKEMK